MRIHGDKLTMADLTNAGKAAGVAWDGSTFSCHGSRTRDHAYEVLLRGSSKRRPAGGGDGYAATWDQWGIFLDMLFMADDTLTIPRVYEDRFQFDYRTSYRFEDGEAPADMHGDHRFKFVGTPYSQTCNKCSATVRWDS